MGEEGRWKRVLPFSSGILLPLPTSGKQTRMKDARLGVQQTRLLWALVFLLCQGDSG